MSEEGWIERASYNALLRENERLKVYEQMWNSRNLKWPEIFEKIAHLEIDNERLRARRHKKDCYLEQCEVCSEDSQLFWENKNLKAKLEAAEKRLSTIVAEGTKRTQFFQNGADIENEK